MKDVRRVVAAVTWPFVACAAALLLAGCGPAKPAVAASSSFQEFCGVSRGLNVCLTYDSTTSTVEAAARQSVSTAPCQSVHLLVTINAATAADRGPVDLCGDWLRASAPVTGGHPPLEVVCAVVVAADGELARQCHGFAGTSE